jgi:hypothetical protein
MPVITAPAWDASPDSGVATTRTAPDINSAVALGIISQDFVGGQPCFRVKAAQDSYVAIGRSPDPTNGPRHSLYAGMDYDFGCQPGDKLAWIAA